MVLLVVDTQRGCFNDSLYAFETVKENIKKLIAKARTNNIEVLYVQHDDGPGTDLDKQTSMKCLMSLHLWKEKNDLKRT